MKRRFSIGLGLAAAAAIRRQSQSVQDHQGRRAGDADGVFHRIVIGDPARDHGMRRGQRWRIQQDLEFRAAAWCHGEYERYGAVRMRRSDLHSSRP